MHQNVPKLPENADFGLLCSFLSANFFTIGFIVSAYPLIAKKNFKVSWSTPSNRGLITFWCLKVEKSWTSRRATLMRLEYLESEDLFTSNGFFKIWNYSSGENFPKTSLILPRISREPYIYYLRLKFGNGLYTFKLTVATGSVQTGVRIFPV